MFHISRIKVKLAGGHAECGKGTAISGVGSK
jgi:hypothetical protein